MKREVKTLIYMLLDILDSINKTSKDNPNLVTINQNSYNEIKNELFSILSNYDNRNQLDYFYTINNRVNKVDSFETTKNNKIALIGLLPYELMDKNKFPDNESIEKLAEKSLNLKIPNWKKRSRYEIIGVLISNIANSPEANIELFAGPWKEFIANQKNLLNSKDIDNSKEFVDIWLDFFDKYKERNK